MIIAQGRYLTDSVIAMLPKQPSYTEESRTWDSKQNIKERKMKAWIINPVDAQIVTEKRDMNYAE